MQIYCIFLSTSFEKSLSLLRMCKIFRTFAPQKFFTMYQLELENPYNGEKKVITVPEEMSIEDLTREIRCEMGLEYTTGTQFHMIIDQQERVFMMDDSIAEHVDMLWEGGDDPDDPNCEKPYYREDFYFPESQYGLQDLFPKVGSNILYAQDFDKIYCELIGVTEDE